MSALTDLFTALANKIRSKTGTATTYTPLEMVSDGIDDVYDAGYAAGGGGATGIPITPSNAAPVTLTNGESYSMLANGYAVSSYTSINPSDSSPVPLSAQTIYRVTNGSNGGYAIASYSSVTPSNSSPVSLSSGSIYKMGGNGKAVASVTDATPSNSSPVSLTSGTVYKMGGAGKAVASVTDITPSSSAPSMSNGTVYKAGGAGYAIDSYTSISSSQLTNGVYFTSGFKKMASSGYAYATEQPLVKVGSGTLSTTADTVFTVGFKPKYLAIRITNDAGTALHVDAFYDERFSTTNYQTCGAASYLQSVALGSTSSNRLKTISSTGFTWTKSSSSVNVNLQYFAIG